MLPWLLWAGAGAPSIQADFTLERGSDPAKWYSRHAGETFGSVPVGDLTVSPPGGTITRVWDRTSALTFNSATGSWMDWRAGPGATSVFVITTPYGEVVYRSTDQHSIGGGFISFTTSAADRTIFGQVLSGDEVRVVIRG